MTPQTLYLSLMAHMGAIPKRAGGVETPIPDSDEFTADCVAIADAVRIPKGWTLVYDVQPWMGCDVMYHIHKAEKAIEVTVYSARYPETLYGWIHELAEEVNSKMGW